MKDIDIWPSYKPKWPSQYKLFHIWACVFIRHNAAIIRPIGLKFFMVTQETTIYRLVVRNHVFDAFKKTIFGGKMGVDAMVAPTGLGPQDLTKK